MRSNASRCAPGTSPAARQLRSSIRRAASPILGVALLALLFTTPLSAGSVSATMQVSVSVIARAIVTVSSQPDTVTVSADDVARGYVDVSTPISLLVRTNSRAGCMLQVDRSSNAFSSVELTFGDAEMNVGDQAWISRPYVPGGESLVMHARVYLASGVQPGSYPLAMAISARPL